MRAKRILPNAFVAALLGVAPVALHAQDALSHPELIGALRWRNIGPNRGGRSIAASGSPGRPYEFHFGATGGGVWKTTDGGTTWVPVSDGQLRSSSVGAIAVAPSNPDVVYAGMGETQLRGNVMQGDGIYRSSDAGRNWSHVGLSRTQAIGRIRVHPRDPDLVYAAALGHPYAPNGPERPRDALRTELRAAQVDRWRPELHDDRRAARRLSRSLDRSGRAHAHDRGQ
ncbi:MAG: WD40/YVTN/BNR-like repeat-containing protein [Longimicrobiales bacterium]